ncbi:MAG: hypothetical protein DRP64_07360 [Verrucomicrobia bacterium]|nr:MAG: hypothetical protein DRP64_07360 [Verrucomicrobiota bacterium]
MKMKRTMVCLTALLMVCGAATAAEWINGDGDRNAAGGGNWNAPLVPGEWLWVHTLGGVPMDQMPILDSDVSALALGNTIVGFNGTAGGSLDLDAGGKLNISELKIGWDDTTGPGVGVVSLNDATSEMWVGYMEIGNGGIDATLNNSGVIHGARLYVGGWDGADDPGTGQVNLLGGDLWVAEDGQFKVSADSNVDITDGRLILAGDQTALVNALLVDDRLTGFGASADSNIQIDLATYGGWTTVTAIPEPATLGMVALFGTGMLWVRKRRMI